ncbi:MAG: hypothetical protein K2H10_07320, partial [Bacteroidales bacterium]|nr:hypothetical protein [Bacteroidales bacterium]
ILSRLFAAVLLTAVFSLSGCVDYKNLKITSFSIDQLTPSGLRSLSGTASVGVDNPSAEFSIYNIEGTIRRGGVEFGTFSANPVTVAGKSSSVCKVSGTMSLSPSVPIFEVLSIAASMSVDDFTVSVSCTVKPRGGAAKKVNLSDVPARAILNKLNQK